MTSRISTSLCRIIFDSPKANGALLFMTILSTDLKVLKQWGYDSASTTFFYLPQVADFVITQLVDRIVPRQKAERQAAEKVKREEAEKAKREEVAKVGAETRASSISKLSY
jgi:hypothetical protein